MKRTPELQPLSRDHHDALRLVLHVQKGFSRRVDPGLIAEYVTCQFEQILLPHFKQEERHILELMTPDESTHATVQQVLDEHYQLERLAALIRVKSDPLADHLGQFVSLLKAHVKLEEGAFFPYVEQLFEGERLQRLGGVLAREARPSCPTWEPQFWL